MNPPIVTWTCAAPPVCEKEIWRYAGCRSTDGEIRALLSACMKEVQDTLTYKVCWRELAVTVEDDRCDFGVLALSSKHLARNLNGCRRVILFAATVGVGIDRLIAKYGRLSPAKALMLQAIGAERIEALCDAFCADLAKERGVALRPRFSPGYGDVPLAVQKDIFDLLECSKRIGLSLNDSLLMSPAKSVTAFVGLTPSERMPATNKCSSCLKTDCTFRGAL